jgi:CheY-like chemotaxis protein
MGQSAYRTLIVDDEPQVRELTSRVLSIYNFQCDVAEDGNRALAMCDATRYEVVVTDLRMPHRHGHSFVCELLQRPNPPRIFVVTGLSEPRLARELVMRGVEDVIQKPIAYDELAIKLLAAVAGESGPDRLTTPVSVTDAVDRLTLLRRIEQSVATLSDCFEERLEGLFSADFYLPPPPKAVNDFIDRLAVDECDAPSDEILRHRSARKSPRVAVHLPALAVPVDENFAPLEDPFRVTLRDISEGGLCMLHTRSVAHQYLALSWSAETLPYRTLSVVTRITRCSSLSRFYDIGGQFQLTGM